MGSPVISSNLIHLNFFLLKLILSNRFFITKTDFNYYNFYLIKNYFFIFYFLHTFSFNKNKDFKNFYNKNILNLKLNNINISSKTQFTFNLKLTNYFVTFLKNVYRNNKNNNINFIHLNNNLYYLYFFNKNFFSFFFNFNFYKNNFLILDTNYSYIYPLYKYVFGVNTLSMYKTFFFIKPIYFTHKN